MTILNMGHYGFYVWTATGMVFFCLINFSFFTKKENKKHMKQLVEMLNEAQDHDASHS